MFSRLNRSINLVGASSILSFYSASMKINQKIRQKKVGFSNDKIPNKGESRKFRQKNAWQIILKTQRQKNSWTESESKSLRF